MSARHAVLAFALALVASGAGAQSIEPRIANGVAVTGWPELAVLETADVTCSLTLVGCRTAVTAAHCVCSASGTGVSCGGGEAVIDPTSAVVVAPSAGVLGIGSIEIPDDFSFPSTGDIAVLRLAAPIRGVRPRPINEHARPAVGTDATILGYGDTTQSADDAGLLRQGAVVTASCSDVSNANHLCWNFQHPLGAAGTDSNTCPGDSGGPLFADVGVGGVLVGVHSGGTNPCQNDGTSFDTDVYVERDWLRQQAGTDLDATRCGDGPQIGEPGGTNQMLAGSVSSQVSRNFTVTAGTKLLRVGLTGEVSGDVDLYVRGGAPATTSTFTCSSAFQGGFEACEVEDPAPGTWYALVVLATGAPSSYQLTVSQFTETPAPPAATTGDVFVSNFASFETTQVNLATGARAVQSSSLRGSGPTLTNVEGVALDRDGTLLAANPSAKNLLRIDPASGDRTIVSGCADDACSSAVGSGPAFLQPRFVVRSQDGSLLVADRSAAGIYAIVRVDRTTGSRTIVSGCTSAACGSVVGSGPAIGRLFAIAELPSGTILAADGVAVFSIDPRDGARTLLSGCTDANCTSTIGSGPAFGQPTDIAIDGSGIPFVTYEVEDSTFGALRRVDPTSGARTLISGCQDLACSTLRGSGPAFVNLFGVAFDRDGSLLVTDAELNALLRVDPVSGDRTLVSGCGDAACVSAAGSGPAFGEPLDIAVLPEVDATAGTLAAALALALAARAKRRQSTRSTAGGVHLPASASDSGQ